MCVLWVPHGLIWMRLCALWSRSPNKPFPCTHAHAHTETSKATRLCGAPVCPRHTETDRGSLSFTRRLKQQERVTWSETCREKEVEGNREGGVFHEHFVSEVRFIFNNAFLQNRKVLFQLHRGKKQEKTNKEAKKAHVEGRGCIL